MSPVQNVTYLSGRINLTPTLCREAVQEAFEISRAAFNVSGLVVVDVVLSHYY